MGLKFRMRPTKPSSIHDDVWLQLWLNALPGPSQPTKVQPFFLPHDASCCSAAADGLSIIRLCIFLGLFLFSGGDTLLSGNRTRGS